MTTYTASKAFTYSGADYAIGDAWQPMGHRVDKLLIAQRFVREVEAAPVPDTADTAVTQTLRTARGRGRGVPDARV